jgi:hypothetical protein
MPKSTRNYWKAAKFVQHHVEAQIFHFFDDDDRGSIERAYRDACAAALAMGAFAISVWRMPTLGGPWDRNRRVAVIGESRSGGRLVDEPFGRDLN